MKVIIAIDPGVSGGVAVEVWGKTVCHPMPATQGDVLELIRDFKRMADVECVPHGQPATCECVLEEVNGFVGKAQPGAAMFKFGEGYGFLKGVVQTLGIPLVLVRPQVWQKAFGLGTASRCASKTEWKNKLKAEAQRRFPHLPVTLATADALLILEWARRAARANGDGGRPSEIGEAISRAREDRGQGSEDRRWRTDDRPRTTDHGLLTTTISDGREARTEQQQPNQQK